MFLQFSECISLNLEPPRVLLNINSELMRLYPWIMRFSTVLHRIVQ